MDQSWMNEHRIS